MKGASKSGQAIRILVCDSEILAFERSVVVQRASAFSLARCSFRVWGFSCCVMSQGYKS